MKHGGELLTTAAIIQKSNNDSLLRPIDGIPSSLGNKLYIDNFLSLQSTYLISSFTSIVQDFDVNFSNNVMGQSATYWIVGKNLKPHVK